MTGRGPLRLVATVAIVAIAYHVLTHHVFGMRNASRHGSDTPMEHVNDHMTEHAPPSPGVVTPPSATPPSVTSPSVTSPSVTPPAVHVTAVIPDTAGHAAHDSADADDDDNNDADDDDAPSTAARGYDAARTLTIGRQLHGGRDSAALMHVKVSYGVGTLGIAPADAPWLYNVRWAYTGTNRNAAVHYDTAAHALDIGATSKSNTVVFPGKHDTRGNDVHVALARGVPLDLDVEFGAGEGDLQLGGLSLRELSISTGASEATVRFDAPNPVSLERMKLEVGAAAFKAVGLGNAHVQALTVEAGIGDVDLDFSGHWTGDMTVDMDAALGAVHIHVPRGVVVEQTKDKTVIGSMDDNTGGTAGAGGPQTPGGPLYHLRFRGTTTLGAIEFDRAVAN